MKRKREKLGDEAVNSAWIEVVPKPASVTCINLKGGESDVVRMESLSLSPSLFLLSLSLSFSHSLKAR